MRSDEEHRHRCEVRQVLRWRMQHGREWVQDWLAGVERFRGKPAADRIRTDAASQWAAGNRGKPDDWR